MSRLWDEGTGVFTEDADDLELGCMAYSRTHSRGDFPRGGTVVGLNLDDSDELVSVFVLEQPAPGHIDTWELVRSDVDMDLCDWHGRNAQVAASIINRWLTKHEKADRHVRLMWQRRALALEEAAASGLWLKGAELRYRRHVESGKAAS